MPAYDLEAIKANADLLGLAGGDLRRVASTRGGEYAGACPKCGGHDRFHVQPETGLWMCRQCHPGWGDAIEFAMWRDGLDFRGACEALGGSGFRRMEPQARPRPAQSERAAPGELWQARARAFCEYAQGQLWERPEALAYLRDRGLSDNTIREAGLGYNPGDLRDRAGRWGLDGGPVWLPVGWAIPCETGGVMHYVKIRRPGDAMPKYAQPRGGKAALYGADDLAGHTDAVLCEGEFDALLLRQEVAGLCGVATWGSATAKPSAAAVAALGRVRRLWTAYDADKAGRDGAEGLGELSARIRPLPWPDAAVKDATDLWLAGHDLAAWAVASIGPSEPDVRAAWLVAHLERLDDAAFEAGADETAPALRVWLALFAELRA